MSDMDYAGVSGPGECGIPAGTQPIPLHTSSDMTAHAIAPRRGGNGGRPEAAVQPLRRIIEAVLFASDKPVSLEELAAVAPDCPQEELARELESMSRDYGAEDRGFQLQATGAGYQICTHPGMHEYVTRFLVGKKRARLSRAAMETLAIVAYRQPITRGEAEQIRGVDCGHVLHTLLDRGLLTVKGRSQALGRPLLYGTTEEFLHYFGIRTLADLPSPEELRDLIGEDPLEDLELRELMEVRGLSDTPAEVREEGVQPAASGPEEGAEDPVAGEHECHEERSPSRTPAEISGDGYVYAST